MLKKTVAALVAASMVSLAGCGSGLDGTYGSDLTSYTFKRNGTVVVNSLGAKVELKYELDGKDIRISSPQGVMIMTLGDDDSIQGPMGIRLTRQK